MSDANWREVDEFIAEAILNEDDAIAAARSGGIAAGLPDIAVSAAQGKLLYLLARSINARRVLEIGALGGYSAIWLARAVGPDGRVTSLEIEPKYAALAKAHCVRAGVGERVEFVIGPAIESLPKLERQGHELFDFTFIDADKPNCPAYFDWAVRLSRPGALIVVDNVVRNGRLADADSADAAVQGMRRMMLEIGLDRRVSATTIQTVGAKGYDGLLLAVVCG
ncbi:MAG: O-methyltransferase [Phycisphaerales bacterium]|nr:O-methyltransferase [Phycisphaerales bacterium]